MPVIHSKATAHLRPSFKKIIKKTIRVLIWIIASIAFLILLVIILIQIPGVQNFGKKKIVAYLEKKLQTKVVIQQLAINFPKQIELRGVYFEDQQKDTLFAGNRLRVDISMLQLLRNRVEVNYIELDGIYANIYRTGKDTVFNYQYIIDAFSDTTTQTVKDSSGAMVFSVGKIKLNNINGSFKDDQTGVDGLVHLGKSNIEFEAFDPDKMKFAIPVILLDTVAGHFYQVKPLLEPQPAAVVEAESNEPFNISLALRQIGFNHIRFDYRNDVSPMRAGIKAEEISGDIKSIDLAKLAIQVDKLKIHNTSTTIELGKSQQTQVVKNEIKKETAAQVNNPWSVSLAEADLVNNQFIYNDHNTMPVKKGMDYAHLAIDSFTLQANNIALNPATSGANITAASFREKSGFVLRQLQTNFVYTDSGAALNNLHLETNQSIIRNGITIQYPSVDSIVKNIGALYVNADMQQCRIAVTDVITLVPQLNPYLSGYENAVIALNSTVSGYVNDLSIPVLQMSGLGNTAVNLSGSIKGMPDINKTSFDIDLKNFSTSRTDLLKLLPAGTLPANVNLPASIKANGTIKGTPNNIAAKTFVQTDKGNVSLSGTINMASEKYDVTGRLDHVNAGYLLQQDSVLGNISLAFAAKGAGFNPGKMYTNASADIAAAFIKGYNYRNLKTGLTLRNGHAVLTANMQDPNIAFDLDGEGTIQKSMIRNLRFALVIDSLHLQPLGITSKVFNIAGSIAADIPVADIKNPEGTIKTGKFTIQQDNKVYSTDSIFLTAASTDSGHTIALQSQVLKANLSGKYNLATIANGPLHVINQYYATGIPDTSATAGEWQLQAVIIPDTLLFALVPALAGTDSIKTSINYSGNEALLNMQVNAPLIKMGNNSIDSLSITAFNTNDRLNYGASFESAGSKGFMVRETRLTGHAQNNELTNDLVIKDAEGKDKYELAFKAAQIKNAVRVVLLDSLRLDYNTWTTNPGNAIQYDSTGLLVKNFSIAHKGQALEINSATSDPRSPVDVHLKDFRIKTLTNFADQDSLLMDGVINGTARIKNLMTNPVFTAGLTVNDLSYNADTVGNLSLSINNETANTYQADIALKGKATDVTLNGQYVTGTGNMNLQLAINQLNLALLKMLSAGAITGANGNVQGKIDIAGTAANPAVNGAIQFVNAAIVPAATNERLQLTDEKISIKDNNIHFDQFTLTDSAGNQAILDGDILTGNFKAYSFDLNLSADNFRVLNSAQRPNQLYYGKLNIDANVSVKGPLEAPAVNADLTVNKETDVTLILPGANPEVESREGVVEFFDADHPVNNDSLSKLQDSLLSIKALAGMDISATIQSDTSAKITLITDERSGDAIKIQGKANIAGGIDKSGKISLTGSYELQSGFYQVSVSVLKKQFAVQPGSIITWNGDPTSATVDITAHYVTTTQPINLMESELAGLSPADVNRYKARVPFNVVLKMKGDLMKPIISFDIKLNEEQKTRWPDVESKLQYIRGDEGELNKQVFALLLLNRFVQENPLKNSAEGNSFATTAKSSVSKILADQINNLAGSLIQGVDLNVGINSEDDYTSGTAQSRTDLTVGISKKLLNDRLRVSVGSNFELEGPANTNEEVNNIAGDIAVDYLLSKDGRYTLRAYRRNRYEGVVEGQVVESGVSFLFTVDFDSLKQLFKKQTAEQKRQKAIDKKVEQEQKEAEKQKNNPAQQ